MRRLMALVIVVSILAVPVGGQSDFDSPEPIEDYVTGISYSGDDYRVVRIDSVSGRVEWSVNVSAYTTVNTPYGDDVISVSNDGMIYRIDAETGDVEAKRQSSIRYSSDRYSEGASDLGQVVVVADNEIWEVDGSDLSTERLTSLPENAEDVDIEGDEVRAVTVDGGVHNASGSQVADVSFFSTIEVQNVDGTWYVLNQTGNDGPGDAVIWNVDKNELHASSSDELQGLNDEGYVTNFNSDALYKITDSGIKEIQTFSDLYFNTDEIQVTEEVMVSPGNGNGPAIYDRDSEDKGKYLQVDGGEWNEDVAWVEGDVGTSPGRDHVFMSGRTVYTDNGQFSTQCQALGSAEKIYCYRGGNVYKVTDVTDSSVEKTKVGEIRATDRRASTNESFVWYNGSHLRSTKGWSHQIDLTNYDLVGMHGLYERVVVFGENISDEGRVFIIDEEGNVVRDSQEIISTPNTKHSAFGAVYYQNVSGWQIISDDNTVSVEASFEGNINNCLVNRSHVKIGSEVFTYDGVKTGSELTGAGYLTQCPQYEQIGGDNYRVTSPDGWVERDGKHVTDVSYVETQGIAGAVYAPALLYDNKRLVTNEIEGTEEGSTVVGYNDQPV